MVPACLQCPRLPCMPLLGLAASYLLAPLPPFQSNTFTATQLCRIVRSGGRLPPLQRHPAQLPAVPGVPARKGVPRMGQLPALPQRLCAVARRLRYVFTGTLVAGPALLARLQWRCRSHCAPTCEMHDSAIDHACSAFASCCKSAHVRESGEEAAAPAPPGPGIPPTRSADL